MPDDHNAAIDTTFGTLRVHRVAGHIGGEVLDFKLGADLAEDTFASLYTALLKYKVLFFHSQQHLDDNQHQAFGKRLGRIVAHPTVPAPTSTQLFELNMSKGGGRADSWHTDATFLNAFPKVSILRAVTIPAYGGNTVWANTARAYEQLSDTLKQLAEQLWAVHTNDYDYGAERTQIDGVRLRHHREVFTASVYETSRPVVYVHPEASEHALLLGYFTKRFTSLPGSESTQLFGLLQNRVTWLDNTVCWRWCRHDAAIWNNRVTQHCAINDYGNQPHLIRHVTVYGDMAVSVDGNRSAQLRRPEATNDAHIDTLMAASH